ncbi:unnamed protein product [Orchesella dallaii]|uniref:Mannan endo-1,4-beta-mannosidase n=1 Tax=Orchesella dallaii TaxID=48710 RepID=A0ABP1QBW3_9HEXA
MKSSRLCLLLCCLAASILRIESVSRTDVIQYLSSISGSKIISGQHNREPNSDPAKWTRIARDITGLFPGLWGGDFLFLPDDVQNRQSMVDEAIRQWNAGSVVALTWHVCPPTVGETCNWDSGGVLAALSNDQWNSLIQNGGDLNQKWKQRLDTIVPYLQQLQDAGVVVIWRPIHEMNEGWSWWGGRPGSDGSRKLYEITHDYLSPKFNNLIWVWCVKDVQMDSIGQYWPGANYVDVASLDVWMNNQPSDQHYQDMLNVAQGKPIALAEVGQIPSPAVLERQNRWVWFMIWAEYLKDPAFNSDDSIKNTYYLARTLRQGELTGIGEGGDNLALNHPIRASSQESSCANPENIVDGSTSTRWITDESEEQWIYVDLEAPQSIQRVVIEWEAAFASSYQIQTSNDADSWTTVYENYSGSGGSDLITLSQAVSARYVKLYVFQKGTAFRYSVREIEVYS